MSITFDADKPLGQLLQTWWEELQERNADRAELCRAQDVTAIMLLPAFQRACPRFKPFLQTEYNWEARLASVLGLLAHVRDNRADASLARQMADTGNPPPVSELRFRRLLQRERGDLYLALIRVLRLLDNQANLHDLADAVYYWGEGVKRRWAFDYFPHVPEKNHQ